MKWVSYRHGLLAVIVLFSIGFAGVPVQAQLANEPELNQVVVDGFIYSLAQTNNVLYLGGLFSQVGRQTGGWAPVSASTAVADAQYPQVNGGAYCMAPDGNGGWFLGGRFTVVGGLQRSNLVHIRKDRTVDPLWNPGVNNSVTTLALTNGILYFGGTFTNVAGQSRGYVASVDAASGALTAWNPNPDGSVNTLVVYGTNVYLGGYFSNLGSTARRRLAAVDLTVGTLRSWNPGTSGSSDYVQPMVISGSRLFLGGRFTSVGGQTRNNVASIDLTNGSVEAWNPNASSDVGVLAMGPSSLFMGGFFSTIGSSNRSSVAEVDISTGLATAWDPQIVGSAYQVNSLLVYSNRLYVGGLFYKVGTNKLQHVAAFDLGSSTPLAWNPKVNFSVVSIAAESNTVYLGGLFGAIGCVSRTNMAAYDLGTKQVTSWSPVTDYTVYTFAFVSNTVYFGGEFTNVNGVLRRSVAAVDINTGALTPWSPAPDAGYVYGLAVWSNRLYVGGSLRYNSLLRTNLFEFDLTTGAMTSWDPVVRASVFALQTKGDTLFAGGLIVSVNGVSRHGIVAFDLPTGTLKAWNPLITSGSVQDFTIYSNRLYAVGIIRNVNGFIRTNFVALDTETAEVLPISADADTSTYSGTIYSVAATSNRVFLTGNFVIIKGQSRSFVAALDTDSGQLLPWNPNTGGYYGQTARVFGNTLYVGGPFYMVSATTARGLVSFPLEFTGSPAILPQTAQQSSGGYSFQFGAPTAVQATVWGSSNLTSWDSLRTVPVVSGAASFTDTDATNRPRRFYRVSVP